MALVWNPYTGNFQIPTPPENIAQFGFTTSCIITDSVGSPVIPSLTIDDTIESIATNVYDKRRVVGIIFSKSSDTQCFVATQGVIIISGASFTRGLPVWISTTGELTTTVPTTGHRQMVGNALTSTKILINVQTKKHVIS